MYETPHVIKGLDEVFTGFSNVHQIARYHQETRHVEGVDNPLGIRIRISDIDQMKGNHQYDEDAFQEIQFVNS